MDKIEKALKKLSVKEREQIKEILFNLQKGKLAGLDVKKLKGRNDIFRAKKGDLRIIYRFQNSQMFILAIERRRKSAYKF